MKKAPFLQVVLGILLLWNPNQAFAQVQVSCNPEFDNGCSNWRTKSISVAGFSWAQATSTNCTENNFTADTVFLAPGIGYSMTIQNGSWCGTAVWVDLNQDNAFDTSENLYYKYLANENNTYQFTLTLPESLAPGAYALRVVTGWGTDCFSESENGFGPCGIYTYGNFQDFVLKTTAISSNKMNPSQENRRITAYRSGENRLSIDLPATLEDGRELTIVDLQGRVVKQMQVSGKHMEIPLHSFSDGLYRIGMLGKTNILPAVFRK